MASHQQKPRSAIASSKRRRAALSESAHLAPRPARLVDIADPSDAVDRPVAAAYGWPEDIAAEDALACLLALNPERAKGGPSIPSNKRPNRVLKRRPSPPARKAARSD
jgi:hypothetical protein